MGDMNPMEHMVPMGPHAPPLREGKGKRGGEGEEGGGEVSLR